MTLNLTSFLGILVILIGGVGGAVGAWGFLKAVYAKTQIEALRGDRDDLTDRVTRLEHDLELSNGEREALKNDFGKKLLEEETKRVALEGVVTGKETLVLITRLLEQVILSNTRTGKVMDAMAKEMGLNVT